MRGTTRRGLVPQHIVHSPLRISLQHESKVGGECQSCLHVFGNVWGTLCLPGKFLGSHKKAEIPDSSLSLLHDSIIWLWVTGNTNNNRYLPTCSERSQKMNIPQPLPWHPTGAHSCPSTSESLFQISRYYLNLFYDTEDCSISLCPPKEQFVSFASD